MWRININRHEGSMLKYYAIKAIEFAMNKTLSMDDTIAEKLRPLNGAIIQWIILPLNQSIWIHCHEKKLTLSLTETTPNTTIQANPIHLMKLGLFNPSKTRQLFENDIIISGDLDIAEAFQKLFQSMDIDWERHLSRLIGNPLTYYLSEFSKKTVDFAKNQEQSMQANLTEYLQEEIHLFPPREALDDFFNDIFELTLAVERLEAKIELKIHEKH
jgi:ubiquinone biosynthesis protein UbiJ